MNTVLDSYLFSLLSLPDLLGPPRSAEEFSEAWQTFLDRLERVISDPTERRLLAVGILQKAAHEPDPGIVIQEAFRLSLSVEAGPQAATEQPADPLAAELLANATPEAGEARDYFARVVHRRVKELWLVLEQGSAEAMATLPDADEGMDVLAWDEHFAAWLVQIGGKIGQKAATKIRKDSRERKRWIQHSQFDDGTPTPPGVAWDLWFYPGGLQQPGLQSTQPEQGPQYRMVMPALAFLALVLWRTEVGPAITNMRQARAEAQARLERNPGALLTTVYGPIGDALSRRPAKEDVEPLTMPLIPVSTVEQLDRRALGALGTLQGHRLFRWLVITANEGWHLAAHGPLEIAPGIRVRRQMMSVGIVVEGGLQALAAALKDHSKKMPAIYRDILHIFGSTTIHWDTARQSGSQPLIAFEADHAVWNQRAELRMDIFQPLIPGSYQHLPPAERLLVPVLPVPATYAPRNAADVTRLDWLATRYLTESRREAVAHGGVVMPWERLADQAGVTRDGLRKALALWTSDDNEPARWERVSTHRWMLSDRPPYLPARRFILEGGERSEERAEGGRRAAKARTSGGREKKKPE